MKNIHILPTDQPSRLHLWTDENGMRLALCELEYSHTRNTQHIYITSDEEIKKGEYYLGDDTHIYNLVTSVNNNGKKIILTTNIELIEDGVQAIDDEFLEWFVKNPTCEFVKVIRNKKLSDKNIFDAKKGDLVFNNHGCGGTIQELSNDIRVHIVSENGEGYIETAITADNGIDTLIINNYKVYEYTDYKLIMPQEEPKQESHICKYCDVETTQSDDDCYAKPKQETLEEYIEKYSAGIIEPHIRTLHKMCFKDGAKWMEERRYSDEDVLNIIFKFTNDFDLKKNIEITSEEQRLWFEKYKKK
jgi:hypothetical protein